MHHFYDRRGRRRPATPWVDRQPSKATIITALILVPLAIAATGDGAGPGISLGDLAAWAAMTAWWALIGLGLALVFLLAITAAVLLAVAVIVWAAGLHLEDNQ